MKYVALIHSYKDGYLIRGPKGRPSSVNVVHDNLDIDAVRKSMSVNRGNQILLAFAWTTSQELKLLKRYPDFISIDVTEKTNKEKRGLLLAAGVDGNRKAFICLHVFMPNAQMRSFGWIYKNAIPTLWGDHVLQHVKVVITDGEQALYMPIENLSDTGT